MTFNVYCDIITHFDCFYSLPSHVKTETRKNCTFIPFICSGQGLVPAEYGLSTPTVSWRERPVQHGAAPTYNSSLSFSIPSYHLHTTASFSQSFLITSTGFSTIQPNLCPPPHIIEIHKFTITGSA